MCVKKKKIKHMHQTVSCTKI